MTALVTGGSRGLGLAMATALSRIGMRVAIVSRSPTAFDSLRSYRGDVTDPDFMRRTIESIEKDLGPLTLVVNNAGILGPIGPMADVPHEEWWRVMEVNVRGTAIAMQLVLPRMCSRGGGRVINIVSGGAIRVSTYYSAYSAAKAAVVRLTEGAAAEVRPYGVRIFAMEPGTVATDMSRFSCDSEEGQRWIPWFKRYFDEGLTSTADDVAQRALDLASGRADVLSGRYIPLRANLDEMIASAERIDAEQLYALRIERLAPLPFIPAIAASETASPTVMQMRRLFVADRVRMFSLWTDSEAARHWFTPAGEPEWIEPPRADRAGLHFHLRVDGNEYDLRATTTEFVQNERIVYDWSWRSDSDRIGNGEGTIVTVIFRSRDEGCEVVIRHERLPSTTARDAFIRGWVRCLDGLERLA
ncbi:MAG TPA: SDR family NAD(P)-dependent oxidoreductase [Thermoanaerobaculia bacterium]|nr:SDR family NAD(P)-dependent oxidoreductase [Thermoanaerobaculia bacterium]